MIQTLIFIMIAGMMNGSYAVPVKYFKSWDDENIWLVFSLLTFLLMPWLSLIFVGFESFSLLFQLPFKIISILASAGIVFGIGMIVFTLSLRFIGLGIAFVLNISISTVIATLLPIIWIDSDKIISLFGSCEIIAVVFFCIAVVASYFASQHKKSNHLLNIQNFPGIFLGVMSGILTSAQGFSYAFATNCIKEKFSQYSQLYVMNIPWVIIFSAAFIPYFLYFLYRSIERQSWKKIGINSSVSNVILCVLMALLYYGSIILFSISSSSLGKMGVVIGWPLLMIFIIVTSNLWSFIFKEWKEATLKSYLYLTLSFISFSVAIISLTLAKIFS